jgi:hypothetical protein
VTHKTKITKSCGSRWREGEVVYGPERDGSWAATVCIAEREITKRGRVVTPAQLATITADTRPALAEGFDELGFEPPRGIVPVLVACFPGCGWNGEVIPTDEGVWTCPGCGQEGTFKPHRSPGPVQ